MGTNSDLRHDGSVIRYDADVLEPFEPRLFDVDWLRAEGHHQGSSSGRGEAHFLTFGGREMVLRPFRRGGLVGRFNRDLYWRTGIEDSRAFREFALLQWMREAGLPVPRAVAARVSPRGLVYRAALVTERIPDARPMEEVLSEAALPEDVWHQVGSVIRRMHDAGVDHTDLNCRNILIDKDAQPWLIDFDKCRRRPQGPWTEANLARLKRSLNKWSGLHWQARDWDALRAGYAKSDGAPAAR
ncbi:MAG: 3-deoxy-D-manno-octulosonic acid kinase [Pseudomonadota bacterium]